MSQISQFLNGKLTQDQVPLPSSTARSQAVQFAELPSTSISAVSASASASSAVQRSSHISTSITAAHVPLSVYDRHTLRAGALRSKL